MAIGYYGKGSLWGLPELGITELFGGEKQSTSDATVRRTTGEEPIQSVNPYPQDFGVTEAIDKTLGTSFSSSNQTNGGGGGGSWGGSYQSIDPALYQALETGKQVSTGTDEMGRETFYDPNTKEERTKKTPEGSDLTYEQIEEARRREEELLNQRREAIKGTYGDIISELDRQVGLAPQRRAEQESGISQLSNLQTQQAQQIAEQNIGELRGGQQEALRDLTSDIRNQMQAAGRFIGNIGAGTSSAAGQASEAITRAGQQSRADVIKDVGNRIQSVRQLASQQLNNIQQWKASKMADIASSYNSRVDELNTMKAQAKGQQARDIQNAMLSLEQDFINRVRQLDDSAREYGQTVSLWQQQRQADLQDYASKLAMQAQYGGISKSGANYQLKTDDKGNTYLFDPDTGDITATGVVFEKEPGLESIFGQYLQSQTDDSSNGGFLNLFRR